MIVFGTGHRPEDAGYSREVMVELAERSFLETEPPVSIAVCGMAGGFDLAFALAAISADIDVWAVRPWAGHRARKDDRQLYDEIMDVADRVVTVNPSHSYPGPWVYQNRNEWMVDVSDEGRAFWNGKESGGTYNCLHYARLTQKPVLNLYPGKEGTI